ncbi:hypothetical protein B0A48_01472 [Cryoendolithus antarcticus]|uniref:tyrosinase n=1 Tax=Cryoendolithus antarcticus TaxID=1507870 RepID=A0A1V8TPK1_9PEZI|nr:hypothetical protein B0A48_01472 [Cryoendolithus antarcticus]
MLTINVICAFAAAASAFPTTLPTQHTSPAKRQDGGSFIHVTGVEGAVGWRQEIFTLKSDADAWNVYMLALERFKDMPASDPLSWYQIAGIHGQPYVAWDSVGPCDNCTLSGYCTHQSTLFPTWHRPYLALFEQSLINNAYEVANEFEGGQKDRYLNRASVLRMPFWDWAQNPADENDYFPSLFRDEFITVTKPQGDVQIENPLLRYHFKNDQDHSFIQGGGDVTWRNPTFNAANRAQLRSDTWAVLTSQVQYNAFSTQSLSAAWDNQNPYSIEALHDQVHINTGGQMGIVPQAAFDPFFWIHHAQVDHVFALWQAAHPDVWVQPWSEIGSSTSYAAGSTEDASSDLTPFHSSTSGGFYSSDAVRKTETFTYLYADLASGDSAANIINRLYRDSETPLTKRATPPASNMGDWINRGIGATSREEVSEYIANVEVDSQSMEGSFTIYLFDGTFDESKPEQWHDEPNLIGAHGFFSSPKAMGDGTARVNAGISLTGSLASKLKSGGLKDLSTDSVTAYLKEHIEWKIVKADGSVVDKDDVPGLQIAIMTSVVQLPGAKGQIARWGGFEALPDVTKGRKYGFDGEWKSHFHGHGHGRDH